jgi:hypothetical protein
MMVGTRPNEVHELDELFHMVAPYVDDPREHFEAMLTRDVNWS